MSVREYLKHHASDYFYAIAIVLSLSFVLGRTGFTAVSGSGRQAPVVVIIDAGHGGMDGGTKSADGIKESGVNLEISLRLRDMLRFLGMDSLMTRTEDTGLDREGTTVREKKNSDLRNRVRLVNETHNGFLISIHQNHFAQSRYSGPQVFYATGADSQAFAEVMQQNLNSLLAPDSNRSCKAAQGVYLMEHIKKPGILIECGFLSNPAEAGKLQDPLYQKKLAAVIAATAAQYIQPAVIG